jgi:SAM-dependent methyltransferase
MTDYLVCFRSKRDGDEAAFGEHQVQEQRRGVMRRAVGISRTLLAYVCRGSRRGPPTVGEAGVRYPVATTSKYYQYIHQTNTAYKTNNWLITEIESILSISPKSILEVGCGNGRFLAAVRGRVEQIIGVDWARSPILDEIGVSLEFKVVDITRDELPKADIVCSADVLEHIAPHLLQSTLRRLHDAGCDQYHVIACYDDGHSHLSIMDPEAWLDLFRAMSPRYQIINTCLRRGKLAHVVCTIATFQPKTRPTPGDCA